MSLRLVWQGWVLAVIAASLVWLSADEAQAGDCVGAGWQTVSADCAWTYSDYSASANSGDGHTWVVNIQCGNGGICTEYVECNENGQAGFVHDVYMDGTDVGDVCVPMSEIDEASIAQLVVRQFRRIQWPDSNLFVQPPGGKTLVNFETNFYTPDHQPIEQVVTVANQQVTIRATPTSYTFRFGDDDSTTTSSPGAPHPNLDITHVYDRLGTYGVSLATSYSGEYRIGNGGWTAIPETLTVEGPAQDLEVLEAVPQLVLE